MKKKFKVMKIAPQKLTQLKTWRAKIVPSVSAPSAAPAPGLCEMVSGHFAVDLDEGALAALECTRVADLAPRSSFCLSITDSRLYSLTLASVARLTKIDEAAVNYLANQLREREFKPDLVVSHCREPGKLFTDLAIAFAVLQRGGAMILPALEGDFGVFAASCFTSAWKVATPAGDYLVASGFRQLSSRRMEKIYEQLPVEPGEVPVFFKPPDVAPAPAPSILDTEEKILRWIEEHRPTVKRWLQLFFTV